MGEFFRLNFIAVLCEKFFQFSFSEMQLAIYFHIRKGRKGMDALKLNGDCYVDGCPNLVLFTEKPIGFDF